MKTVTFDKINLKEFSISKNNEKWTISLVYGLVDTDNKEWATKRATIRDNQLTAIQKQSIAKVLTAVVNKIKQIENI